MVKVNPLFFENSEGHLVLIAEVQNMQETFAEIKKFCDEYGYKIHYTRFWLEELPRENGWKITFDVGSWSEFFHLYFDTQEQADAFRDTAD